MSPSHPSTRKKRTLRPSDPDIQFSDYLTTRNLIFSAEELRQFIFCPRIPFFRHVRKYSPKGTFLMERGTQLHDKVLYAEKNDKQAKTIRKIIVPVQSGTEQFYDVMLESPSLQLLARFDLYEKCGDEYYPVEIKTGVRPKTGRATHHYIQLAVQARLLEEKFQTAVTRAKVVYVETGETVWVDLNGHLKNKLTRSIEQLQNAIFDEVMPEPTPHQGKCQTCEYYPLCKGI
jgi:CRISPR-associated exonuclease Cas4